MSASTDQLTCYRCDEPLDDVHRVHLCSSHEGVDTDRYRDVDRYICLDCLAAIGMLEFADGETERRKTSSSAQQNRWKLVRSSPGGDD